MIKRILLIAFLAVITFSCSQSTQKSTDATAVVLISELVSEPLGFENHEVSFEGVITHICRHSGDKMRVNQSDDTAFSIMVMLNDLQTQFSPESEGKAVKVTGILKTRIRNLDQLTEAEQHDHEGEEGHECASTEEAIKKLQEKGITPDVVAYVELTGYEIIETPQSDSAVEETKTEEAVEVAEKG